MSGRAPPACPARWGSRDVRQGAVSKGRGKQEAGLHLLRRLRSEIRLFFTENVAAWKKGTVKVAGFFLSGS